MMRVDPKQQNEADRIDLQRCYAKADKQIAISRRGQLNAASAFEAVSDPAWYVLTVRDGSEFAVDNAVAQVGKQAGWSTWFATEEVLVGKRRVALGETREKIRRASFKGYVFAQMRWSAAAAHWLMSLKDVFGMIGGWESPTPVGAHEFVEMKAFFDLPERERKKVAAAGLKASLGITVGDSVSLTAGPLQGVRGEVVAEADVVSMWVEFMLFGRLARAKVDLANLTKLG